MPVSILFLVWVVVVVILIRFREGYRSSARRGAEADIRPQARASTSINCCGHKEKTSDAGAEESSVLISGHCLLGRQKSEGEWRLQLAPGRSTGEPCAATMQERLCDACNRSRVDNSDCVKVMLVCSVSCDLAAPMSWKLFQRRRSLSPISNSPDISLYLTALNHLNLLNHFTPLAPLYSIY